MTGKTATQLLSKIDDVLETRADFVTPAEGVPFLARAKGADIEVRISTGNTRLIRRRDFVQVINRALARGRAQPGDHADISVNASYIIALLLAATENEELFGGGSRDGESF